MLLKGIPQVVSDHCPLLLATDGPKGGTAPFRFENMWFQHKSFKESILSWWNQPQTKGWAAFRLQKTLLFIKEKLKIWNREVFGSLAQQKEILSQQIDHLDHKESDSGLTEEELGLRKKLKEEIQDIANKEEISWKQKSRINWLKHGDNNTSFFHKFANGRKARNFISLYILRDP